MLPSFQLPFAHRALRNASFILLILVLLAVFVRRFWQG